jgi:hypothetical protein
MPMKYFMMKRLEKILIVLFDDLSREVYAGRGRFESKICRRVDEMVVGSC